MAKSFARVAEDLRKSAATNLRRDSSTWAGDESMIEMFEGDYKDTISVARLIEKGNIAKAMEEISDMDTGARDEVGVAIHKKSKGFYTEHMIPEGWCI